MIAMRSFTIALLGLLSAAPLTARAPDDPGATAGAQLTGRVVDDLGFPIVGARLRFEPELVAVHGENVLLSEPGPHSPVTVITNETGRFSASDLPPLRYCLIELSAPGHQLLRGDDGRQFGVPMGVDLAAGGLRDLGDLVLARSAEHCVRVLLDDGTAPERADIRVESRSLGIVERHSLFGTRSEIEIPAIPGDEIRMTVECDGHEPQVFVAASVVDLPAEVVFARGGSLEIRFDVPEGAPAVGRVELSARRTTHKTRHVERSEWRHAGTSRFDDLPPGPQTYRLDVHGYPSQYLRDLVIPVGETVSRTIALLAPRSFPVLVRGDEGPVAGANVTLGSGQPLGSSVTDVAGRASIDLAGEPTWARVELDGRVLPSDPFDPLLDGTLLLRVHRTVCARVRVVDPRGTPLAGESVFVLSSPHQQSHGATTGADGVAVFDDLRPGEATIEALTRERTIEVRAGEVAETELVVPDLRTVHGRITIDGRPVRRGEVRVGWDSAPVESDGSYRLCFRTDGDAWLTFVTTSEWETPEPELYRCGSTMVNTAVGSGPDQRWRPPPATLAFPAIRIPARPSEERSLEPEVRALDLELRRHVLRGRVVDADGSPRTGSLLLCESAGTDGYEFRSSGAVVTGPAGEFEFPGLAPGEYAIRLHGGEVAFLGTIGDHFTLGLDDALLFSHPDRVLLDGDCTTAIETVPVHPVTLRLERPEAATQWHITTATRGRSWSAFAPECTIALPVGRHRLLVTGSADGTGSLGALVDVAVPCEEPVVVSLAMGHGVRARIVRTGLLERTGWPLRVRRLDGETPPLPSGLSTVRGECPLFLPAGRYRVECDLPDGTVHAAEFWTIRALSGGAELVPAERRID